MSESLDTRRYAVAGMTCGHCATSVREEIGEVAGVSAVDVDLAAGSVSVRGVDLDDTAIRAAIAAAGYEAAV